MKRKWFSRIICFSLGVLLSACSPDAAVQLSAQVDQFDRSGAKEIVQPIDDFVAKIDAWDGTIAIPLPPVPRIPLPAPGSGDTPKPSGNGKLAFRYNYDPSVPSEYHSLVEEAGGVWSGLIGTDRSITLTVYGKNTEEGWLASAKPDSIGEDGLPTTGTVNLNLRYQDDFVNHRGYFEAIVVHEMGHILGIGSLWDAKGLISQTEYKGAKATQFYGGSIKIEPRVRGHWDESVQGNELMTPFAEKPGNPMILTQLTLCSLEDIGWTIANYGDFKLGAITPEESVMIASGQLPTIYQGDFDA